jgi:Big-like domain-containing protein
MNKLILFACVLSVGVFFNSCKDEGDVTDPVVTITEPAANSSYAPGDTIMLRATVTDDEELKTINVSSDLGLDIPITTFDSPTSHVIGYNIEVNAATPTGAYTLTITGIDASANEGAESVSVTIQ